MNTQQEVRTPRGNRRRKSVIDLNAIPGDQEGTSASSVRTPTVPTVPNQSPPTMIDVDAVDDDDVIESSASAFAEAKSKATRSRRPLMIDVESGSTTRLSRSISSKRRRIPPNQPIIDCEHVSVNVFEVDIVSSSMLEAPAPAPPPEEPKFSCPICMCPFTEEMSTKCGHIFCKDCIKKAITKQAKCPTCRKRVTARELIRVFLPSTR